MLAAGAMLRVWLVVATAGVGVEIVDEQHYATLAFNLLHGLGLAWEPGHMTSLRPPLYPAFVAFVWGLTVPEDLTVIRLVQVPIGLLTGWIVYLIGVRVFSERAALIAAGIVTFYPSLLFSGVLILSETLFTLLLMAVLLGCLWLRDRPRAWVALATGACLGASALTRSIMWPSIAVLVLGVLAGFVPDRRRRVLVAVLLVVGYAAVVAPWSYRNTQLQGTFTVIDTMGGQNLMLGNYAHTPEDRMWDAISLSGEQKWNYEAPTRAPDGSRWTEGGIEHWARDQAVDYILANPVTTLRRSVLKFADFWGIEREYVAGVGQGLYRPSTPVFLLVTAAIVGAYAGVMILAAAGLFLARPADRRAEWLLVGVVLFMAGLHSIVFGHSRYHLPLVPVLALYAAAAIDRRVWRGGGSRLAWLGAWTLMGLTVLIWMRDVFVRDADKIAALFAQLGLG